MIVYAIHVSLKDMLKETQKAFKFDNMSGTLVCVYYPDFMDGINAAGWHIHFVSDDRQKGGHVFDLKMKSGQHSSIRSAGSKFSFRPIPCLIHIR